MIKTKLNGRWPLIIPKHRQENWRNKWEVERLEALHSAIKPGDIVVDIGAEEGDISALMASWGAKVVLVEPSPNYWPVIRKTFDANKLKPLDWFVGFFSDKTELHPQNLNYDSTPHSGNGMWPNCAYMEHQPKIGFRHLSQEADATKQIPLDQFMTKIAQRADILNIDVEGAELEVLKGAHRVLTLDKPMVFVSVHPEFMHNWFKQFAHDLFRYMAGLGYEHKVLAYDHEWHVLFTHPEGRQL